MRCAPTPGDGSSMPADSRRNALIERAQSWAAGDPDPVTRSQLEAAIANRDGQELEAAVGTTLTFGTAGIRGRVGPGSGRMNAATVIRATAGLASHIVADGRADRPVVLGFDARPSSRRFAELAAGVLAAADLEVRYFGKVTPTPIVAFAALDIGAGAAVVVTASHNPPADNGYKVYGENAAQIIPPEDSQIASAIDAVGLASEVELIPDVFDGSDPRVSELGTEPFDRYRAQVMASRPSPQESSLEFVYTAMHGVGGRFVQELFVSGGHSGLRPVSEQFSPDGSFPTVAFPNPEEPGALDLALDHARELGAPAVIANDPDADRLAASVLVGDAYRQLTGNELGALLGDVVLRNWRGIGRPIVANSIVSSPILERMAMRYDARHTATLTGFKWIINAALELERSGEGVFAFGFEEALGYSVGPAVRDKDGMSAALVFADLVAEEASAGRTVVDRLHEIWSSDGLWVSCQRSLVREGPAGMDAIRSALAALADAPPSQIQGHDVTGVTDYRTGAERRPLWLGEQDLLELKMGESGRILARPSGTEPKLKIYVDLCGSLGTSPETERKRLVTEADSLAAGVEELLLAS